MSVEAGESYRFEQEVYFDGHLYQFPMAGQCQIRRGADGYTWNGSDFDVNINWNVTTIDASNEYHYYDWVVPGGAVDGETYIIKLRLDEDPNTESVGNTIVRDPGSESGGGDVFIFPINVFDD